MFSDKEDFKRQMITALDEGTLISDKHDISSLEELKSNYRTVVVVDNDSLKNFINNGDYTLSQYRNNDPKHTDGYVVVTPNDSSFVPASGVPPMSYNPTHPCDVFVAVSGPKQGLHLFGEVSANVEAKKSTGTLTYLTELL